MGFRRRGTILKPAVLSVEEIGEIFSNNFNSSVWTELGTGTTWTYNTNSITAINNVGTFDSFIRYNNYYSQSESYTIRTRITVNTTPNDFNWIAVGCAGVPQFDDKMAVKCLIYSGNNAFKGYMQITYGRFYDDTTVVADIGAGRVPINAGDVLEIGYTQSVLTTTFTCRNITQASIDYTISWTNSNAISLPYNQDIQMLKISQVGFWCYKGNFTINEYSFINNEYKNIPKLIIGDSKVKGYFVNLIGNRVSNLIAVSEGSVCQISASGGGVTQDIVNCLPEILTQNSSIVVMVIGRNDVADSVPPATWQANYLNIVNQLQLIGVDVYHQLPLPEAVLDQSALTNWINLTFPANKIIPIPTGWSLATDVTSDGVHLTPAGALKVKNNILLYI